MQPARPPHAPARSAGGAENAPPRMPAAPDAAAGSAVAGTTGLDVRPAWDGVPVPPFVRHVTPGKSEELDAEQRPSCPGGTAGTKASAAQRRFVN